MSAWDDGAHSTVKRVKLTYGDVINSIEVEYDSAGKPFKSQRRGTVGSKSDEFTLNRNEYITELTGYYKSTVSGQDVITALTFKTNQRTLGPYGSKTSNFFSANAPKDTQIVGFKGSSSNFLNSIDVHFGPVVPTGSGGAGGGSGGSGSGGTSGGSGSGAEKVEAKGGKGGKEWNDGSDHDGVKKIVVGAGKKGIHYVKFDYDKSGQVKEAPIRGATSGTLSPPPTFVIGHPDEYVVSVVGYYEDGIVQGIKFKTNKKESQFFGYEEGTEFTLEVTGKKIVGFHGYADTTLNSIGAYFVPISSTPASSIEKVKAQGGQGGQGWDDGSDHDGVRKIVIGFGRKGVHYIKTDYDKSGQLNDGPIRGLAKGTVSPPFTFEINHPDEYLVLVTGYHDGENIQGIQFKTNKKESQVAGYPDGTRFTLEVKDKKIVGFHGYADTTLNSIGAYCAPLTSSPIPSSPVIRLDAQGGKGGVVFDDGAFDGVRKVYIGQGSDSVTYVKFEYEKGGKVETREHGKMTALGTEEFEVEPDEYITSVEGYYDKIRGHDVEVIISLIFKTSKGKTSPPYGMTAGKHFALNGNGGKLIGFHGSAGNALYSLGTYFAPSSTPLTPPATKVEAQGGKGDVPFDDGTFDDVKKVSVGQGDYGVAYVKFEYKKGGKMETREHGKMTMLEPEEFELDPDEYITSVEGCHDLIRGKKVDVITTITFKTSKGKTSQPFGLTAGKKFALDGKGGRLVGFHGTVSDVLHSLGAYFAPPAGK